MKPYWVTFERLPYPTFLNLGVGVTARTEDDARNIVAAAFGEGRVVTLTPVEDISSLDQGHVVPNMGSIFIRGVWFPKGYEGFATHAR